MASAIPAGYISITPYLVVRGATAAIDFYQKAFAAKEMFRMAQPDGRIGHAEIKIGNAIVMLADEYPEMGFVGPQARGGASMCLLVYVEDVDACYARALAAGAKSLRPVQNQFYGDRAGTIEDPFGHYWTIATHKEDVAPEELKRRHDEMMKRDTGA